MNERTLDHLIDVLVVSLGVGLLSAAVHMRQPWLLLGLIPLAFGGGSLIQKLWRH